MDAPCEIQGSIHVFRLVNNMCPGKWVHINLRASFLMDLSHFYVILDYAIALSNTALIKAFVCS